MVMERISVPFNPTEMLQKHLRPNNLEYAKGGRRYSLLPITIDSKISYDEVEEAGFVWLDEFQVALRSRNLLMAVYAKHSDKGVG